MHATIRPAGIAAPSGSAPEEPHSPRGDATSDRRRKSRRKTAGRRRLADGSRVRPEIRGQQAVSNTQHSAFSYSLGVSHSTFPIRVPPGCTAFPNAGMGSPWHRANGWVPFPPQGIIFVQFMPPNVEALLRNSAGHSPARLNHGQKSARGFCAAFHRPPNLPQAERAESSHTDILLDNW